MSEPIRVDLETVRRFDRPGPRYTSYPTAVEFTEEVANEMGHTVAYGDSVTGDRPVVTRDPSGAVRVLDIETLFERATATRDEVLITADGGSATTASRRRPRTRSPAHSGGRQRPTTERRVKSQIVVDN